MTIQKRLTRSNVIMLVVPIAIAGVLLVVGLGIAALLLQTVYLPKLGLTLRDLHNTSELLEEVLSGLELFVGLYLGVVVIALLAAVAFTNLYLTKALFSHIQAPLDTLVQGVQRVRDGDLETPIAYEEADEFRPACDAVDEMAARLHQSLAEQQREQQKKQELIAGMSHDLKSPLTTIRAYTEALLEGVASDDAMRQRYLERIYARETELEALVNRLFELAKLNASEYPAQLRPLTLRETLRALVRDHETEGIAVSLDSGEEYTVRADRELLARIVGNLLDNSRKYGAHAVSIVLESTDTSVTVRVSDDGPGVPEEQLPNLFHPFYRGDAARTKPGGGSGLGLAVVQKAAEQMKGRVAASNGRNGGLCVTLTLPRWEG